MYSKHYHFINLLHESYPEQIEGIFLNFDQNYCDMEDIDYDILNDILEEIDLI